MPRKAKGLVFGTSAQREAILAHEIPLAPTEDQRAIFSRLDAMADKARQAAARLDVIDTDAGCLLLEAY